MKSQIRTHSHMARGLLAAAIRVPLSELFGSEAINESLACLCDYLHLSLPFSSPFSSKIGPERGGQAQSLA
jgi:hypothetical protein